MQEDYAKALPRLLVYEGGKVDDKDDPGGRTAYGVTQGTYNAYRRKKNLPKQDVWLIWKPEIAEIYKTMYWDRVQGDKLPAGLDYVVNDGAVNSGTGQSGKWLQQSCGGHFTGMVDGVIGDKTLQAIDDAGNVELIIVNYCSRRLATLKRLKGWKKYGGGWSARIANSQKIALAWARAVEAPDAVHVADLGGHRKAPITDITTPVVSQIATHAAAGGASVGTIASQTVAQLTPLTDTFKWVTYVCGGLTLAAVVAGVLVKVATDAGTAAENGLATAKVDPDADALGVPIAVNDDTDEWGALAKAAA